MTATVALQLAEQHKLDLDVPIQKYCPRYPEKKWPVTARDLISHTSGVRHYEGPNVDAELFNTRHYDHVSDSIDLIKDDPLKQQPGEDMLYTTWGYVVLGCVLEGATQQEYRALMCQAIFDPAGMASTRDDDPRALVPNRARGYVFENGELKNSRWSDMSSKMAAGGWVSTAPDLVHFMNAWMEGRLVSQSTMKQMLEPYNLRKGTIDNFGLGMFIDDYHGMKAGLYGGGTAQVSALIFFVPEKRLAVAGMFNLEGIPGPERIALGRSNRRRRPRRNHAESGSFQPPEEAGRSRMPFETERVPHPSAHFALEPALSAAEGVGFHGRLDRRILASGRTDADVSLPPWLDSGMIRLSALFKILNMPAVAIVNISDFRPLAQRRLPKAVFDYLDGGADAEITLRENCRAFDDITFRPRCAVAFSDCGLKTSVLGHELSFPAMLAPIGYSRLMHPGGEVAAASAAGKAGTAYILSTISAHPLEKVKAATAGPAFYQLYLLGGRAAAEAAIDRARTLASLRWSSPSILRSLDCANVTCVTASRNCLASIPFAMVPFLPNILAHPRWLAQFLLDGGVPTLANVVVPGKGPMQMLDVGAALAAAAVTWNDLGWIREHWRGPIVVKGVLTAEDAKRAVDEGAAAISVSNHGGRQLDGVRPSIRALPEVVAAVKGQAEVWMDGGIRRGSDIVKALCLGARAVLCGRAYAYALSAAGEAGVTQALKILRADVERTTRLLGCPSVQQLDESFIEVPAGWKK